MKKYVYENATVYITKPTEEQIKNIQKATERFAKKLVKRRFITNDSGTNNRRISISDSNARKRNKCLKT